MLDTDAGKQEKKRKKLRVYLEYVILFSATNIINLEKIGMGGLDYKEVEWWVEMETF